MGQWPLFAERPSSFDPWAPPLADRIEGLPKRLPVRDRRQCTHLRRTRRATRGVGYADVTGAIRPSISPYQHVASSRQLAGEATRTWLETDNTLADRISSAPRGLGRPLSDTRDNVGHGLSSQRALVVR
ncbi:MAG: hypothetical protein H6Q86_3176 [candidate division NC10 bacterium]|nr:hypothetical protein [candidate division NC10 bacterium]